MSRSNVPLVERFWGKVQVSETCWKWVGMYVTTQGQLPYGLFKKTTGQRVYAHRLAFEMAYGGIPECLFVLHECDNPKCVRPTHLKLGTHEDNMRDMTNRKRQATGERNSGVKMTAEGVLMLRQQYELGVNAAHLGKIFKIGKSQAHRIARRKSWRHLP